MKTHRLLPLVLLLPAAYASAGSNALYRSEHSCLKVPTPDARADCERRQKDEKKASGSQKQANDLCFTRQSTGERVCPN